MVDGVWIGKWIATQKKLYDSNEKLTKEQRELLSMLPLDEVCRKNKAWFTAYADAKAYYNTHHNLRVPHDYIGKSGIILADWIIRQRRAWKFGNLSSEQIRLLNDIGFIWKLESTFITIQEGALV